MLYAVTTLSRYVVFLPGLQCHQRNRETYTLARALLVHRISNASRWDTAKTPTQGRPESCAILSGRNMGHGTTSGILQAVESASNLTLEDTFPPNSGTPASSQHYRSTNIHPEAPFEASELRYARGKGGTFSWGRLCDAESGVTLELSRPVWKCMIVQDPSSQSLANDKETKSWNAEENVLDDSEQCLEQCVMGEGDRRECGENRFPAIVTHPTTFGDGIGSNSEYFTDGQASKTNFTCGQDSSNSVTEFSSDIVKSPPTPRAVDGLFSPMWVHLPPKSIFTIHHSPRRAPPPSSQTKAKWETDSGCSSTSLRSAGGDVGPSPRPRGVSSAKDSSSVLSSAMNKREQSSSMGLTEECPFSFASGTVTEEIWGKMMQVQAHRDRYLRQVAEMVQDEQRQDSQRNKELRRVSKFPQRCERLRLRQKHERQERRTMINRIRRDIELIMVQETSRLGLIR
ncbi:unnamed protein product [Choristocarpus tenellus]